MNWTVLQACAAEEKELIESISKVESRKHPWESIKKIGVLEPESRPNYSNQGELNQKFIKI